MILINKKIEDLIPYVNNARTHNDAQIAQIASSIKEFGFRDPILVDENNMILCGHGRVLASRKLGLVEVPTISTEGMSEIQKKAFIIAHNKIASNAGWDEELLSLEFEELKLEGYDFHITGFGEDEISALNPVVTIGLVDEDEVPEVQEIPITVLGDIYQLGNHRLMCGDSTQIDHVEKLCINSVDMFLTDPPYNVAYEGATKEKLTIINDSMEDETFRQFLADAFSSASTVMKAGAVFYIWHSDSEGYNFRGACRDAGWKVRQNLIWKKNSMVMGKQDYHWRHESCLYGWKDGAGHLWSSDRKQTTILEFDRPSRNGEHPTMKPVALFEYQILNNTKGGDIVLDLFGGSGTTNIACEKNGRVSYLMELDPKYCDVIVKRWEDFTGRKAELINDLQ